MFMMVILLMTVAPALPHCPSVPINRILFSVIVTMVAAVPLLLQLAVAPLLSIMVPMLRSAASFGRMEFVLSGSFLEIIWAQVLLGVVVPMKGLLLP